MVIVRNACFIRKENDYDEMEIILHSNNEKL